MEVIVGLVVIYLAWGFGLLLYDEFIRPRKEKVVASPRYETHPACEPETNDQREAKARKKFEECKVRIERSMLPDLDKESMLTEVEIEYAAALRATLR